VTNFRRFTPVAVGSLSWRRRMCSGKPNSRPFPDAVVDGLSGNNIKTDRTDNALLSLTNGSPISRGHLNCSGEVRIFSTRSNSEDTNPFIALSELPSTQRVDYSAGRCYKDLQRFQLSWLEGFLWQYIRQSSKDISRALRDACATAKPNRNFAP